jgi:heat shock protein HslJ
MRATAATLLASILALALVGCARLGHGAGGSGSPAPSAGTPDVIGAWALVRGMHDGTSIEVPDDWRVTMQLSDDGEVGGQACNHYGGTYDLDGDRISFSAMSMTEMACEDPMMSVEAAYHAALAAVARVAREGDRLTLSGDATELVYEVVPPVPDAALQDTSWMLDSLIQGDAVASVQGNPGLMLNADGTLAGATGCRDFVGAYVVVGDEVQVTTLTTTDQACAAGIEAQDRFVLEVIEGGFSVTIEGDRLTLGKADGIGLGYRVVER